MSVTQSFENVNINQSGTSQLVESSIHHVGFTEAQGYCLIICSTLGLTLIGIALIMSVCKVFQTCILKLNFISKKQKEELKREILEELRK